MVSFLRGKKQATIRLVVGINQVDKMFPGGWDARLNMPTPAAEKEIRRRSADVIRKLAKYTAIPSSNLEYYSALKRYRLLPLLSKIVRNAYAGFRLDEVQPTDPFALADPDVRDFAEQQRQERMRNPNRKESVFKERLLEEMGRLLSKEEMGQVAAKLRQERARPPEVAVFGKTGVGKTTTINNLFNAKLKTSHTIVGTTQTQLKEFSLDTGGTLTVLDLPGYGRTIAADKEYEEIYRKVIPSCDLVLLVLQANSRDLKDDEEMIRQVADWLKDVPVPKRE
jgi:predicted GTPase